MVVKNGESFIIDFSLLFNENNIRKDWQDENVTEENLGMYDKCSHKIVISQALTVKICKLNCTV